MASSKPGHGEAWEILPDELLERVLRYLPISALCRFRTVCKKWAHLLTQPSSTTNPKPQSSYLFRTPNIVIPRNWNTDTTTQQPHLTWELTDTATQQQHLLDDTFLFDHVKHRFDPDSEQYHRCTIAADKGLLVVLLLPDTGGPPTTGGIYYPNEENGWYGPPAAEEEMLFVVNPLTKSLQEVPPLFTENGEAFFSPSVAMVVADDMAGFKIFVVLEDPNCFVFESELGEWREFAHLSPVLTPCHVLKVDTILYFIVLDKEAETQHQKYKLYGYDTISDMWVDTGVTLPQNVFIPQLVACSEMLFFIAFQDEGISIWKIDLVKKKCFFVAKMLDETFKAIVPMVSVDNYYYKSAGIDWSEHSSSAGIGANILALGSDRNSCIVMSSISGVTMAFSLVTNSWINWSSYAQMDLQDFGRESAGMFGCLMSTSLGI